MLPAMNWLQSLARDLFRRWRGLPLWRRRVAAFSLLVMAALALVSGTPGAMLVGFWAAGNGLLLCRLGLWVLMHPGVIWRARRPVLAWAMGTAVVLTLLLYAAFEPLLARLTVVLVPGGLIGLLALLLLLAFVGLGIVIGCCGVALGGLLGGKEIAEDRLARLGTSGLWLTLAGALVGGGALARLQAPALLQLAVVLGWPVFSLWLSPLVHHLEGVRLSSLVQDWMKRHLVVRLNGGERPRVYDLRAMTLSLGGFVFACLFAWVGLLNWLQSAVLLWMVREQGALLHVLGVMSAPGDSPASQIVFVTWDDRALHEARTSGSEAGIQARLIRQLADWRAKCIVVPMPAPDWTTRTQRDASNAESFWWLRWLPGQPDPAGAGGPPIAAGREPNKDLAGMLAAAREANRVVLALPSPEIVPFGEDSAPLIRPPPGANLARIRLGTDRLPTFRVSSLPALATHWHANELPPVPWLVFAARNTATNPAPDLAPNGDPILPSGQRLAQIRQGMLLLDFATVWRDDDFAHVPVSSILQREAVPKWRTSGEEWQPPESAFADKLVFIESCRPMRRPSPLGELSRLEALAYATRTLLMETTLRPTPRLCLGLWGAFWALSVGLTSAGRTLFGASARFAAAAMLIMLAGFGVFLTGRWLDPVFPTVAAGGAFLLVTQFSFALERRAKDQNRALLQRFVAPEIVDELLSDPDAQLGLGGRRERVVVLFADVRGFTQFAEEHSPEDVVKVVNAYLHVMTDALNHYGGLLDKYTGDGLMALFRTGHDQSLAVARALGAALAMRDAVLRLSAVRAAGGARSLQVGIALHLGEAVLGLVGNPVRQINFTALGHTVVVAARLQGFASGGEVIVTEDIRAVATEDFQLDPREPVQIKGVSQPIPCYLVSKRRPDPTSRPSRLK